MEANLSVDRIQGLSGGLAIKAPVAVATTEEITLSGLQTVDTIVLAEGDRVLVKDQTDLTTNGLYSASSGSWSRTLDFNRSYDAIQGTLIHVYGGDSMSGLWQLTTTDPVIGTSNLEFSLFSVGGATTSAGDGGSSYYTNFTGDGTTVTFCMAGTPASIADTFVVVGGVVQVPLVDYTLSGNCVTFLTAPGNGVDIYVNYRSAAGTSTVSLLEYQYTATGGETEVSLPYSYTPGSYTLAVYRNGKREYNNDFYTETDANTVTLTAAAVAGDVHLFIIGQLVNNGDTLVVQDGTITANKLASNAVTTDKILDGNVTLAKLADMATTKLLGRSTAGTGVPEEVTINSFTAETVLDANADYLLLWDASASLHKKVLLGNIRTAGARSWQNMSGSRAKNTAYQNTTGVDIEVTVGTSGVGGAAFYASTNGSTWVTLTSVSGLNPQMQGITVPNGHYYKVVTTGSIDTWTELTP